MSRLVKRLTRIVVGAVLMIVGICVPTAHEIFKTGIFLAAYLVAGGDIGLKALRNIYRGRVLDENFLMTIATVGAFFIGEHAEGVGVMLFYQVGELFQGYAVDKSRRSIASLMDIRPDYANVKRNGELTMVDPDQVTIGEEILVKPGEKIPIDGEIIQGSSSVDTAALTGESIPREVAPGDEVLSGCVNINGMITIKTTKEFGESTVNKILDLVENATAKKARAENFITGFAKYYTPTIVLLALIISLVPPLVVEGATFSRWIYKGLTLLVISCPCALVISVPLGFFGGIGGASAKGILIKGGNYLSALAAVDTVVMDKTGTLTKGVFSVQEICPVNINEQELLRLAAHAESCSNHPISASIKKAYGKEPDLKLVTAAQEIPGYGTRAVVDGKNVLAGNLKLMKKMNIPAKQQSSVGTVVHIAVDQVYAGYIIIADEIKQDALAAVDGLKALGVKKTVMLTGDAASVGESVAATLGVDQVHAELLPDQKVEKVEQLIKSKAAKGALVFVGDGINDAPVLARADVGIAMGGLGSDAAIEAADVVIMTDEPSKILTAIKIARKTLVIVRQNIVFSLGVKLAVLILAAAEVVSMWGGVMADVGVTVVAVLNATRALIPPKS